MDLRIRGRVFIVTGGAKGIGRYIALGLAAEGAIPAMVGRKPSDNDQVVNQIVRSGGSAIAVQAELAETVACQQAVPDVAKTAGAIHGLVNNSGLNDGVGLEDDNYTSFVQGLHHSLEHYSQTAHHSFPSLKASNGVILNIDSKVAETGQGHKSAYATANGGFPAVIPFVARHGSAHLCR